MAANAGAITTGDPGHAVAEHNPTAGLAHDTRGGISNPILGMLLFITSEIMFFSGLFAAYFSTRAANSPEKNITSEQMKSSIPRIGLLIPPRVSWGNCATGLCSATA